MVFVSRFADVAVKFGVDGTGVVVDSKTDVGVGPAGVDEGKVETDDEACVVMVTESEDKDCAVDCDVEVNV